VTIILTTHYIEEAEEMADRIGVIRKGELILVEDKAALMKKLGKKQADAEPSEPLAVVPDALGSYQLDLADDGHSLVYTFDKQGDDNRHHRRCCASSASWASASRTSIHPQSSLEDIFVSLVKGQA
jgi:ABC-2 type transport system ATP-binding protein